MPFRRPDASDPLDRVLGALRGAGLRVKGAGGRFRAQCPVHSDTRESLAVTWRDGKVLLRCFAGCRTSAVVNGLGLRMADLFSGPRASRGSQVPVACYAYADRDGVVLAEKVRLQPKSFRWRKPDGTAGLGGVELPVYRLPALVGVEEVLIVEGEKAADALADLGLVATCGPAGAGFWPVRFTTALADAGARTVVVLPDNDRSGRRHAVNVARSCVEHGLTAKIVDLPNLPLAGDVVRRQPAACPVPAFVQLGRRRGLHRPDAVQAGGGHPNQAESRGRDAP